MLNLAFEIAAGKASLIPVQGSLHQLCSRCTLSAAKLSEPSELAERRPCGLQGRLLHLTPVPRFSSGGPAAHVTVGQRGYSEQRGPGWKRRWQWRLC
jgi:hypothetical protein